VFGDLMCLAAAAFWAGIALVARVTRLSRASPHMQLLYQLGVSGIVLTAAAPLAGDMVLDPTPLILGIFAFQSLVIVAIGFTVWFWVLSVYPASDMASFGFLSPVFGVLFGWLIFDETISVNVLLALAMVGAGIYLVNRKPGPRSGSARLDGGVE
ncbi:MAG: EamA family transporter, partial [Proteobacteria bacterium]